MREAIVESKARLKVFIVNIHEDHDIKGLSVSELVDRALYYLGDHNGDGRAITHILSSNGNADPHKALRDDIASDTYRSARMIRAPLESPAVAGTHSGSRTATELLTLFHNSDTQSSDDLEIFVDLSRRSLAIPYLLQELSELDWRSRFSHVTVTLNAASLPKLKCPPHITIRASGEVRDTSSCDMAVVHEWLKVGRSRYLVTLTGDGEYRMADILPAIQVCDDHAFGAVYGSRTQSRRQFLGSLRATYAESRSLFVISWCANFLLALLYGLRFQMIFSDPLTGFRVYGRHALRTIPLDQIRRPWASGAALTKLLLAHNIEISEIPVSYRAHRGFTSVNWRIKRGIQHVFSLLS